MATVLREHFHNLLYIDTFGVDRLLKAFGIDRQQALVEDFRSCCGKDSKLNLIKENQITIALD